MNRITLQLELDYDDAGNVLAWKLERKDVAVDTIEVGSLGKLVTQDPAKIVAERLVTALNTAFKEG
jgi:hypothetical protein